MNISEHFSLEEMTFSETAARRGIGMWRVRHGGGSGAGGAYVRSRTRPTDSRIWVGAKQGMTERQEALTKRSPEAPYELGIRAVEKE
jgi:ribosomal protein L37AE/L43A